jgi:hypothetical protein
MEIRAAASSPEAAVQTWLAVQTAVESICQRDGCAEDESAAAVQRSAQAEGISLLEAALRVAGKS